MCPVKLTGYAGRRKPSVKNGAERRGVRAKRRVNGTPASASRRAQGWLDPCLHTPVQDGKTACCRFSAVSDEIAKRRSAPGLEAARLERGFYTRR